MATTTERDRVLEQPPGHDRAIETTEEEAAGAERHTNLFDIRRWIGGLFLVYGAILTVVGLGASQADIDKAAGVNINLWTGLALLVVGGLFTAWGLTRPLLDEDEAEPEPEAPAERPRTGRFQREHEHEHAV